MSANYENLKQRLTNAKKQIESIEKVEEQLKKNSARYLSAEGGSWALVPHHLAGEFDALLKRCKEHQQAEVADKQSRIDAVDTLLAGFEAKKGGAT